MRPKSREILPPRGVGRQASTVAGFDPPRRRLLAIPIRVDQSVLSLACSGYSGPTGKARVSAAYQAFRRDNLPGDLEAQIEAFVEHYNHCRYHESLSNLTPADVYFGRGQTILIKREKIKRQTIEHRRLQHRKSAA